MWVKSRDEKNKLAINLDNVQIVRCSDIPHKTMGTVYALEFNLTEDNCHTWLYKKEDLRDKDYNRIVGRNLLSLE
jgi:hypothetical protein